MGKTKVSSGINAYVGNLRKSAAAAGNMSKTTKLNNDKSIHHEESQSDSSEDLSPPPTKITNKIKVASAKKKTDEPIASTSKELAAKRLKFPPQKKQEPEDYVDFPEPDGLQILIAMSNEDRTELLERIQSQCPQDDRKQVSAREGAINWDNVSFSLFGPEQCKAVWAYLTHGARKYRIAHEVIEEVKFNLKVDYKKFIKKIIEYSDKYPPRPYATAAFQLYCRESFDKHKQQQLQRKGKVDNFLVFQSECYESWNRVPADKKAAYTARADEIRAAYKQQVKEFYAKYPDLGFGSAIKLGMEDNEEPSKYSINKARKLSQELFKDAPATPLTPLKLFLNSKLNGLDPPVSADELTELKLHYCEKYKALSNKKKGKWIEKCIREQERYMEEVREYKQAHPMFLLPNEFQISKLISRDEFSIYEEIHGKPPKPKNSVFEVFLEEFANSEEAEGTPDDIRKIAVVKFENMDWYQKELYTIKFKSESVNFRKNICEYFNSLPEVLKPLALDNIPKKFHRYLTENVSKDPLALDEDSNLAEPLTPKKERKQQHEETDQTAIGTEETEQGTSESSPKKKKKKKKAVDEEDTPLYRLALTEEHKNLIEKKVNNEKEIKRLKKAKKAEEDDMEDESESHFRHYGRSTKPNPSSFQPGDKVTTHDLNEAVRGIFDGNQHFGRTFSVYYYYAKYVCTEKSWKTLCNQIGVLESAGRMIETFRNLGRNQQEIFIRESYNFYKTRYYGNKLLNAADMFTTFSKFATSFPDEPKLPPRNAEILYSKEMKLKNLQDPEINIIPWKNLDENIQMYYIKKLRKVTKDYINEYERFVKNMTPNDLVEYFVAKRHQWEHRRMGTLRPRPCISAFQENFSSVTYGAELSEDGQDSEPEMHVLEVSDIKKKLKRLATKYKRNPFAKKSSQKQSFVRKLLRKNQQKVLRDSDDPSSSEDDSTNPFLPTKRRRQMELRRKIKKLETYYYPLDDICDLPSLQSNQVPVTVRQRIYEAQTELLKQALAKNIKNSQRTQLQPRNPSIEVIRASFQTTAGTYYSKTANQGRTRKNARLTKKRLPSNTSVVHKGVEEPTVTAKQSHEHTPTLTLVSTSPSKRLRPSSCSIPEPVPNHPQNIASIPDSTDLIEASEHYVFDANDVVDYVGDIDMLE